MDNVTRGVREVKIPRIPPPEDDQDCAVDRMMAASARDRWPVEPRQSVESYMVSHELAHFVAYGRIP